MPGGRPRTIFIGKRAGNLVVLEILPYRNAQKHLMLRCACDCGRERILSNVAFGVRVSCEDCAKASGNRLKTKHGGSVRRRRYSLYEAYKSMLSRCYTPGSSSYKWYGGKGVKVCDEWKDFGVFEQWATANGYQRGLHLDRIDSDKDYCPENCRYIPHSENSRRARAEYHFVKKPKFLGGETQWL